MKKKILVAIVAVALIVAAWLVADGSKKEKEIAGEPCSGIAASGIKDGGGCRLGCRKGIPQVLVGGLFRRNRRQGLTRGGGSLLALEELGRDLDRVDWRRYFGEAAATEFVEIFIAAKMCPRDVREGKSASYTYAAAVSRGEIGERDSGL